MAWLRNGEYEIRLTGSGWDVTVVREALDDSELIYVIGDDGEPVLME